MIQTDSGQLRIAYICADPGVPVFGTKGCSIHVQEVIRAMIALGHHVTLFATRFDGSPPADFGESLEIVELPAAPKGELAVREQLCIRNNAALTDSLALRGPFDLVYERYSLWSYAGIQWANQSGTPSVLEVNAPLIEEHAEQRGIVDEASARQIAQDLFAEASAIITVSQPLVRYVEKSQPQSAGRVLAIPNGVNPQRFLRAVELRQQRGSQPFTVGFVGSLKSWHGVDVLLDAFTQLVEQDGHIGLLIVGDGPERSNLGARARDRGLQADVHFTGAVAHDQVPDLLAQMDVAAAPYLPRENFYFSPMKVYEYMAAAVPVVASCTGQMIDVIRDGETGLLVTPGDAADLVRAIDALRREPAKAESMARAAHHWVITTRSWTSIVRQILSLPQLQTASTGAGS
jgi:glycosyltransferase involved in cell wall biosynthesis